jgi:UDP-galactopyranose mutase
MSWPPQIGELRELAEWPVIARELAVRPARPRPDNFETWCVDLVGETLYREFIEGYTRKQWGVEPRSLAASWAPRRIELRDDGHHALFSDPYQGWPANGYLSMISALLHRLPIVLGQRITVDEWDDLCKGADAIVLTGALDEFFRNELGCLPWRGVRHVIQYLPDVDHFLPCGVVNTPSLSVPYTRVIETKWMSGQRGAGTVASYEYPGAPARHYPVEDVDGGNRALQSRYVAHLDALPGPPRYATGRLATYSYLDMDQVMRQAMNTARRVIRQLKRAERTVGVSA